MNKLRMTGFECLWRLCNLLCRSIHKELQPAISAKSVSRNCILSDEFPNLTMRLYSFFVCKYNRFLIEIQIIPRKKSKKTNFDAKTRKGIRYLNQLRRCVITGEQLRCLRNASLFIDLSMLSFTLILSALLFNLSYKPKEGVPKHCVFDTPSCILFHFIKFCLS